MNQIADKTFMFTGKIRITRLEAQTLVESLGGIAGGSVNKSTDFLVVGEDSGGKLGRAQSLGITCISEDEFFAMVDECTSEAQESDTEESFPFSFNCPDCGLHFKAREIMSSCPICSAETEIKKKEEPKSSIPPPGTPLTYNTPELLQKFKQEHPQIELHRPIRCLVCRELIPYSIHPLYYYCFNCNFYMRPAPEQGQHSWVVGLIKDIADIYTLTKEMLILGYPREIFKETPQGDVWLTNGLGDVVFCTQSDLAVIADFEHSRNFGNCAEFALLVRQELDNLPPASDYGRTYLDKYSESDLSLLYDKWATKMEATS